MISVQQICERIEKLISTVRIPLPSVPAILIACSVIQRPGLSAMMMASEIIRRQAEAGAYFGKLPDGSDNIMEAMERIRCETIVNAIKNDLKIETSISPGSIIISAPNGATIGTNTGFVKAEGIAR